ncbi:MAG: DUF808 family protein, partial [Chromatocurvus sp.]
VYGLVGAIVKIDDLGLYLSERDGPGLSAQLARWSGRGLLAFAPWLMHGLSIVGTAAMFLVGGGILEHGIPFIHHAFELLLGGMTEGMPRLLASTALAGLLGLLSGLLVLAAVTLGNRLLARLRGA